MLSLFRRLRKPCARRRSSRTYAEMLDRRVLLSATGQTPDAGEEPTSTPESADMYGEETASDPAYADMYGDGTPDPAYADMYGDGTPDPAYTDMYEDGTTDPTYTDMYGDGTPDPAYTDMYGDGTLDPAYADMYGDGTLDPAYADMYGDGTSSDPEIAALNSGDVAPSVYAYAHTTGSGTTVYVSGWVIDANPAGLTVTIGGVVTASATTDAFGNFSVVAPASGIGNVTLTVVGSNGLTGTGVTDLYDATPVISGFMVSQQYGLNQWMASGTVFDEAPSGLVVTFGGMLPAGLTAIVEADGTFECSFTWNNTSTGMATATVDDIWSQTSNLAMWVV